MPASPILTLNDGVDIPQIGFGTWQIPDAATATAVGEAISAGYRSIDTAAFYDNERGVGEGLRRGEVAREKIFVATKIWNTDQGYDSALAAFDVSLKKLGVDEVDLYLIHWPAAARGKFVDTWKALVRLREEGRVRSIGVSNFTIAHLKRIIDATGVVPALNQIELHPLFQQIALRDAHAELGIATEAWSPLGRGACLAEPVIVDLARKYSRSPAQIVLRWHVDNGVIAIPKSVTPARIRENLAIEDFELTTEDVDLIATLDSPNGPHRPRSRQPRVASTRRDRPVQRCRRTRQSPRSPSRQKPLSVIPARLPAGRHNRRAASSPSPCRGSAHRA